MQNKKKMFHIHGAGLYHQAPVAARANMFPCQRRWILSLLSLDVV